MSRVLDLAGCWAKLDRAKAYVDQLRQEIQEAGDPDPNIIGLRRQYDDKSQNILVLIDRVVEVRDHWPLVIGDAVYNFRCALDYLAWQLAIRFLNREPTKEEARQVQFPIVKSQADWLPGSYRHLRYMSVTDAGRIEEFQPYYATQPNQLTALGSLGDLSNVDKHRVLNVVYIKAHQFVYRNFGAYIDCDPDLTRHVVINGALVARRDEEVMTIPVIPRGPHPDRELETDLTGYVAVRDTWDVLATLDAIGRMVGVVLCRF